MEGFIATIIISLVFIPIIIINLKFKDKFWGSVRFKDEKRSKKRINMVIWGKVYVDRYENRVELPSFTKKM